MSVLASARTEAGLAQFEMADLVGCAPSTYNQYETGKRAVPLVVAKRIANALGKEVDALFSPSRYVLNDQETPDTVAP